MTGSVTVTEGQYTRAFMAGLWFMMCSFICLALATITIHVYWISGVVLFFGALLFITFNEAISTRGFWFRFYRDVGIGVGWTLGDIDIDDFEDGETEVYLPW